MTSEGTARTGLIAWGTDALVYAHALARCEQAQLVAATAFQQHVAGELQRLAPAITLKRDPNWVIDSSETETVVISDSITEPLPLIRRGLMCGKHILSATAAGISSRDLLDLSRLARKRSRALMFAEERQFHPAWTFLKRMVSERGGLWKPCYVRGLSVPGTENGHPVLSAAVALTDMALCARLNGEPPEEISAIACRLPGQSEPVAVFLNLIYGEGKVASLQVSSLETQEVRRWAVATPSKTVLIDECDARSPLRIISSDPVFTSSLLRSNPPVPLDQWPAESIITPPVIPVEPRVEQCRSFIDAAVNGDISGNNAAFFAGVAAVWEAAEESMARSGMPVAVDAAAAQGKEATRPRLRLIRGRGVGNAGDAKRPALTVVPR